MSKGEVEPQNQRVQQSTLDTASQDGNPVAGFGVATILRRWRREDLMRKGSLYSRGFSLLCCVLSLIIMASNEHGGTKDFHKYEEYRYLLAVDILSSLYMGIQTVRHIHQICTGKQFFELCASALIDFCGDQVVAYFLISAASAATPLTDSMREGADNSYTDSTAASITMAFLAFFSIAFSAIISGYKLSTHSYI